VDLTVDKILSGLNNEQRQAVTHDTGPLMIVAGAGTGKTKAITHRIAYLIVTKKADPEQILALTFTDKAAAEMEERVDILLPYGYANVMISTFHAFGDRLLRDHALELGLSSDFQVLTQAEQIIFFREHLFEFPFNFYRPLGSPTKFLDAILTLYSRAKDEDVNPDEYLDYVKTLEKRQQENPDDEELADQVLQQQELAAGYQYLRDLMSQKGKIDFGDQVVLALKLLRQRSYILQHIKKRFKYILIDEFQDTNYSQYQLVKQLGGNEANVTVVADDDQSIYKFRGAAISNILNFKKDYPQTKLIVLVQNYRSTQAILDTAYTLIRHNDPDRLEVEHDIDKRLISQEAGGKPVTHLHYDTLTGEADAVAAIIEDKVTAQKFNYNDFAILVRANKDADPFMRSLNVKSIPYRFSGNRGLYNRQEIRNLMAFLRVVDNLENSLQLYQLAISEIYRIPMKDIHYCLNLADRKKISLYIIFKNLEEYAEELPYLFDEGKVTIQKLLIDLDKYLEFSRNNSAGVVLYRFLTETNYLNRLITEGDDYKIQNIAKFCEVVHNYSHLAETDSVHEFINHLELLMEAGDDPATAEADLDVNAVNIMTIHKAKGLEFPIVFMVSLVKDKFPAKKRGDTIPLPEELIKDILPTGDFFIQEERRLFYVGMTRAKRELYLTSALDYGGKRKRKISPFVLEALDKPHADEACLKTSALEKIKHFAPVEQNKEQFTGAIPQNQVLSLSHYQIDDYLTCPLKFKFIHILRVPLLPHHTIVYGQAIHEAVREYHVRKMNDREITLDQLIEVFHKAWKGEGFLSSEHEQKRRQAGERALQNFYEQQEASPVKPVFIEKDFSFMIDNDRINGRWDRVDSRDGEVIIVDFKSSEVRKQEDATRRAKNSLQLSIYALAYEKVYDKRPAAMELHFLETGLIGSANVTDNILNKALENIQEAAKGIRSRDYTPKPDYMNCSYCAFSNVCPATLKTF